MTDPTLHAWMAGKINEAVPPSGPFVPHDIATGLVERLRREDPDTWAAWVDANAASFVRQEITRRCRSLRAKLIHNRHKSVFGEAVEAFEETGDATVFDAVYTIDERDGTRMRLGDMTGPLCRKVSGSFRRREVENGLQASFLEALANKAGDRRVRDVLDPEQVEAMMRSIGLGGHDD